MTNFKDNFRPDGKRWACPYCEKCIEGLLEMGLHLESHNKATHIEVPQSELIGYFRNE